MIDINTEHLVLIREVPRRLPPRPTGRCVHISAVYRWIQRGVRGVRLESIRIGGTTYTSTQALQRFADYLSRDPTADPVPQTRTTVSRQKQIEGAMRAVEAIMAGKRPGPAGIGGGSRSRSGPRFRRGTEGRTRRELG